MTFSTNVPDANDSPGIFPTENQTNYLRLQTIISADHRFNNTAQNNDGFHEKVSFISVPTFPPSIPAGANGLLYTSDNLAAGQHQLYYRNSVANWLLTPTWTGFLSGQVNIPANTTFVTIAAIPASMFGEIWLYFGRFIQYGTFISDATVVNGYSMAEKFQLGSSASQIVRLGFDGNGASGLNLRVSNDSGAAFGGIWTYRINYRQR